MKTLLIGTLSIFTALTIIAGPACCPATAKAKETASKEASVKAVASTEAAMQKVDAKATTLTAEKAECTVKADCATKADCDKAACDDKTKSAKADAAPGKSAVIATSTLKELVAKQGAVTILDARTSKYDNGERIPNAKLVGPNPSAEELAKLIPAKDSLVVTYCGSLKCPLGDRLAATMRELGYTNVQVYKAGIGGWVEAGNETQKLALK